MKLIISLLAWAATTYVRTKQALISELSKGSIELRTQLTQTSTLRKNTSLSEDWLTGTLESLSFSSIDYEGKSKRRCQGALMHSDDKARLTNRMYKWIVSYWVKGWWNQFADSPLASEATRLVDPLLALPRKIWHCYVYSCSGRVWRVN